MGLLDVKGAFSYQNNFAKWEGVESIEIIHSTIHSESYDITIAIPTFKRDDILKTTIDSVINQKYSNTITYEVIVLDNNPERGCPTEQMMMECYSDIPNLRYFKHTENIGLFGNWNRCFELAQGNWVALVHDDDFIFDNFIDTVAPILKSNPHLAILKPKMESWVDNGVAYKKRDKFDYSSVMGCRRVKAMDYIFMGNYMSAPTGCIFNRNKVIELGGFDPDLFPSADTMFMLFASMKYPVILYDKILGVQRIGRNETLKVATLEKFIESRYSVISYLIDYFKLNIILNQRFKNYMITKFYHEVRGAWMADFEYDFDNLSSDIRLVNKSTLCQLYINTYKVYKRIANKFIRL